MRVANRGGNGEAADSAPATAAAFAAPPDRTAADVTFTHTNFAEGVSVDPATGSLYIGTGGNSNFALLRATASEVTFSGWLSAAGILPNAPASNTLVVGTRVQGGAIYFCASNPFASTSRVWAYNLGTQTKVGEFAMPAGFCNDLAFDAAGNLFATSNRITTGSEAIYKLGAATVASGSATVADWAAWYSPPRPALPSTASRLTPPTTACSGPTTARRPATPASRPAPPAAPPLQPAPSSARWP